MQEIKADAKGILRGLPGQQLTACPFSPGPESQEVLLLREIEQHPQFNRDCSGLSDMGTGDPCLL